LLGVLKADSDCPRARAGHHDHGHLDDVRGRPRGEHAQHLGLMPAAEERHQAVQVNAAALGHPRHQLPDRTDAGQPFDEEGRELPGQYRAWVGSRRLGVARPGGLTGCRRFLIERRPEIRERDELDGGFLLGV
jgi:hypothetical protein